MKLEEVQGKYPGSTTFTFGDSQVLCDRLLALVRSGAKTATCNSLRAFEEDGDPLPEPGRIDVALNWDGSPALAIRTLSVEMRRFSAVEESFALAEGENESLAGWRSDHQGFFERNGGFDPDMELVCERFELIEDFG